MLTTRVMIYPLQRSDKRPTVSFVVSTMQYQRTIPMAKLSRPTMLQSVDMSNNSILATNVGTQQPYQNVGNAIDMTDDDDAGSSNTMDHE